MHHLLNHALLPVGCSKVMQTSRKTIEKRADFHKTSTKDSKKVANFRGICYLLIISRCATDNFKKNDTDAHQGFKRSTVALEPN